MASLRTLIPTGGFPGALANPTPTRSTVYEIEYSDGTYECIEAADIYTGEGPCLVFVNDDDITIAIRQISPLMTDDYAEIVAVNALTDAEANG